MHHFRILCIKGKRQEKKKCGARPAGVEPDNLAGITGFIIPPQRDDVSFPYGTLYIKQGNSQKAQSCSNQLSYSPLSICVLFVEEAGLFIISLFHFVFTNALHFEPATPSVIAK